VRTSAFLKHETELLYIDNNNPFAHQCSHITSYLASISEIPEALLLQNYQNNSDIEVNFEDDLSILTSCYLVMMNIKGDDFEVHRLVQFSTKKWLELYDWLESWKEKYIDIMEILSNLDHMRIGQVQS